MTLTEKCFYISIGMMAVFWIGNQNIVLGIALLIFGVLVNILPYLIDKRKAPWCSDSPHYDANAIFTPNWLKFFLSISAPRFKIIEQGPGKITIKIPVDRILYVMEWLSQRKPVNMDISYSPLMWYECLVIPYQYKIIDEAGRTRNG